MPRPATYLDVAEAIEARIHRGEYPPGSKLPTYIELAVEFEVGYTTVAKSIALLRDRGIVYGAPPRGVFVSEDHFGVQR